MKFFQLNGLQWFFCYQCGPQIDWVLAGCLKPRDYGAVTVSVGVKPALCFASAKKQLGRRDVLWRFARQWWPKNRCVSSEVCGTPNLSAIDVGTQFFTSSLILCSDSNVKFRLLCNEQIWLGFLCTNNTPCLDRRLLVFISYFMSINSYLKSYLDWGCVSLLVSQFALIFLLEPDPYLQSFDLNAQVGFLQLSNVLLIFVYNTTIPLSFWCLRLTIFVCFQSY